MAEVMERAVQDDQVSGPSQRTEGLDKLDDLWEQYLYWVDEYQKTRKQLGEVLSSGFFSLARANFSNSSQTRYGQDYYDERMQATRRVVIEPADEPWIFEVVKGNDIASVNAEMCVKDSVGPEAAPDEPKRQIATDPLRWFGILVPQALRDSQTYFKEAVEGPIPRLATITRQIRCLEIEISRQKKSLKKCG